MSGSRTGTGTGRLKRIAFVLAAVGASFVVGEVSIRVIARFVEIYDMEMYKYALQLKRRSDHPLLSHEHIPNSRARLMGVDVELNALGHRNGDLPATKPVNEKRIHIIGSSMCLGWGVPQEQTFAMRLERSLNEFYSETAQDGHVLVINAGVGNTNTVQYVEQFKIQRHATEPDVVIMQYYINDSEIIAKKPNNSIYRYSFFLAFLKQNLAALEYGVFRSRSLADYYARLYDDGAPGWLAVKESVRDLKAVAARNNMRLVILFIPDLHDFSKNSAFIPLYDKVLSTFRDMDIDTIDILADLEDRYADDVRQSWVSKQDAHPNAEVHGIIASKLTAYFTSGEGRSSFALFDSRSGSARRSKASEDFRDNRSPAGEELWLAEVRRER